MPVINCSPTTNLNGDCFEPPCGGLVCEAPSFQAISSSKDSLRYLKRVNRQNDCQNSCINSRTNDEEADTTIFSSMLTLFTHFSQYLILATKVPSNVNSKLINRRLEMFTTITVNYR